MTRKPSSRQLAIDTASKLFQRNGYHGTGLAQIIDESGSPKGSFYHHFPGGKEELALEAISLMSRNCAQLFAHALDNCDNEGLYIKRIVRAIEDWLEASEYREGCPVAGFATEGSQYTSIREACSDTYADWCNRITEALRTFGYTASSAKDRGALIIAALDGGTLMSRVAKDPEPLRRVGRALRSTARAS